MHVPRYHTKPDWQRFLVGMFFGGLIAFWVVLFMYGTMYEKLIEENKKIQNELVDAKNKIEVLEEDNRDLDEKSKQKVVVEEIKLEILNAEGLKIDKLLQIELESLVKEEIKGIIGDDIEVIGENYSLILSSIENKTFKVDDFSYHFEIEKLIITPTVVIIVNGKLSN